MRMTRLLGLLLLGGCMHSTLSPSFTPPPRPTPEKVLESLAKVEVRQQRAAIVAITKDPQHLAAWTLDGKPLWQRPVEARSAPLIAGDCVVTHEAGGVVVRSLADGRPRVTLDEEATLVGADGEGERVVVALSYGEAKSGMRSVLALVEGDSVRWTRALPLPVGVPALSGERVIVPWATHRLSVLDARDGEEAARWYFIGSVLGHARIEHDKVYVGQLGLLQVDAGLLELDNDKVDMTLPLARVLPAQPPPMRDGYAAVPEPASAAHRVALDWRIDAIAGKTALHDAAYLRFYRLLFGLDADRDELRFVRSYEHDLVGSDVGNNGVAIVDAAGSLRWLDPEGNERVLAELSRRLQVAALRAGAFKPQPRDDAAEPEPRLSLREQLFAAAATPDSRLVAARTYAVHRLASLEDAEVTQHLVTLCNDAEVPEGVRRSACSELPERANGERAVLAALEAYQQQEHNSARASVAPLALAAAKMRLRPAAPGLLSLFEDLHTPARDLAPLATALGELSYRPASAALERFIRLHHGEPEGSDLAEALKASSSALATLGDRRAKPALSAIIDSPYGAESLREHARSVLANLNAPATPKNDDAALLAKAEADEAKAQEEKAPERPRSLDAKLVQHTLAPVQAKLEQCLGQDPQGPKSTRIAIVVDGDGKPEGIFVTPTSVQACVEPLVRHLSFPKTELGRQRITHVIHRATEEQLARRAGKRPRKRAAKR